MDFVKRSEVEKLVLPGRIIQKTVGKDGAMASGKMTVGFAHYSAKSGRMDPHHHAEETIYVVAAERAWVRYGASETSLDIKEDLETGMTLHFDELEWHVFEYGDGGYLDIVFIYGQTDNIRPEEIAAR